MSTRVSVVDVGNFSAVLLDPSSWRLIAYLHGNQLDANPWLIEELSDIYDLAIEFSTRLTHSTIFVNAKFVQFLIDNDQELPSKFHFMGQYDIQLDQIDESRKNTVQYPTLYAAKQLLQANPEIFRDTQWMLTLTNKMDVQG